MAVVVLTRDGAARVGRSLERLSALPDAPQIIVVDNGSSDGTPALVRKRFPQVELIELEENLGAAGRNIGVERASAPYVAFAEDDSWYAPGSLRLAGELLHRHPDVALINAHVRVGEEGRDEPLHREMAESALPDRPDLPGHRILSFLEGAAIVRRCAFRSVGGFKRHLAIGGPEEHLAADLLAQGWELRYVPEVRAHHMLDHGEPSAAVRRQGLRNALWFAWGRRPPGPALRWTVHLLRSSPATPATALGLLDALRGAPDVLRSRRTLPADVEAQLALLDEVRLASEARDYGSGPSASEPSRARAALPA